MRDKLKEKQRDKKSGDQNIVNGKRKERTRRVK